MEIPPNRTGRNAMRFLPGMRVLPGMKEQRAGGTARVGH
jgi:hypothetical protein